MNAIKSNLPYTEDETNYNGWCNFSTWKAATALLNYEDFYLDLIDCNDVDDVKALCIENALDFRDVNYEEIYEAISS